MPEIPAGAQRSPDGHYWWDEANQAWQSVADTESAGAAAPASSSATPAAGTSAAVERTGTISVELGSVYQQAIDHQEVVAMVERGGAQLPEHEGAGEAYA